MGDKARSITYASNGKRDLHHLEVDFDVALEKLEVEDKWKYDENRIIIIEYLKSCRRGLVKSGTRNLRINKGTLIRVLGILRLLSEEWIKKPFDTATKEDWDKFYERMEDDKILNAYGEKYKQTSKAKNYKTIRKFLKWRYGGNKAYPEICEEWVTTEEKPTKEFLTRGEVERMITAAHAIKVKCLVITLFDGGFRIEEEANLRWEDLRKNNDGCYKAHIRAETSKTKRERHVSLWLSTDLIDAYKSSVQAKNPDFKESDFVFESTYGALYQTIKKLGKRALNKDISPHTMRHSSATYYASIIKTYQQFCSRYGWALRSEAPQRYFHAVSDDEVATQAKDHEIAKFKTEFEKTKLKNEQLNKVIEDMQSHQEKIQRQLDKIQEALMKQGMRELNKVLK